MEKKEKKNMNYKNGDYVTFNNGEEMLRFIQTTADIYDPKSRTYIFVYDEDGSIAAYFISDFMEERLRDYQSSGGLYWSDILGWGGSIYEDPSYECCGEITNIDYCNNVFSEASWEIVGIFPEQEN